MKKLAILLFVAALALVSFPRGAALAQNETVTVTMNAQNGSGEDGTATITQVSANDVKVTIHLNNAPADAQPAHIHKGTCANLNPVPAQPLTNVVNGASDTTVMMGMADLTSGEYAINIHKSAADIKTYVSCGDIHAMMSGGASAGGAMAGGSTMPKSGNGDQPMILLGLGLLALALTGAGLGLSRKRA